MSVKLIYLIKPNNEKSSFFIKSKLLTKTPHAYKKVIYGILLLSVLNFFYIFILASKVLQSRFTCQIKIIDFIFGYTELLYLIENQILN